MDYYAVLALALALDLLLGEPPTAWHPVGWVGHFISFLERRAPRRPFSQLVYGAALVLVVLVVTGVFAAAVLALFASLNHLAYVLVAAVLFKCTFSLRELQRAARRVKLRLLDQDRDGARDALRALVSRDTSDLSARLLAGAAVESVAENVIDSFVSPVFFFTLTAVVFGYDWLPPVAALGYRVVNTADAMIGYHGRYEHLGKVSARLDDVLNWLPARLGALCLLAVAPIFGNVASAWEVMWRDHAKTESPNAGWPMSVAAGALGVTLEKVGHYRLGDGSPPAAATIDRACHLAVAASLLFASLSAIILLL